MRSALIWVHKDCAFLALQQNYNTFGLVPQGQGAALGFLGKLRENISANSDESKPS
ncbi:MAG: hypothetical protein FWD57_15150 [Polyangiaceae bacterium]|nr:hypothetical protein [Polyangiaceae bacterium]